MIKIKKKNSGRVHIYIFGVKIFSYRRKIKKTIYANTPKARALIDKSIGNLDFNEANNIVVSLTSFPARINIVHLTIESILSQSLKPEKVVLWLCPDDFPSKEADLPKTLIDLTEKGLEIDWYHDVRAYTKLIPSLIKYPTKHIVTVDDDIIYHKDWLAILYSEYKKNPDMINCHRGHLVKFENGQFINYSDWVLNVKDVPPSYLNFLTGVGGVLYPPNCFYKDILDEEKYLRVAPSADDIWFWAMCILNSKKINIINLGFPIYMDIENSQDIALWKENVAGGKNNEYLANVLQEYPEIAEILSGND